MIKTGVVGFGGRMGTLIARTILDNPDFALEGALEDKAHPVIGKDAGEVLGYPKAGIQATSVIADAFAACDCIIDFTFPEVTLKVCSYAAGNNKAMVIGSTGFTGEQKEKIALVCIKDTHCAFTEHEHRGQYASQDREHGGRSSG